MRFILSIVSIAGVSRASGALPSAQDESLLRLRAEHPDVWRSMVTEFLGMRELPSEPPAPQVVENEVVTTIAP